jgi:hypothetical protein
VWWYAPVFPATGRKHKIWGSPFIQGWTKIKTLLPKWPEQKWLEVWLKW